MRLAGRDACQAAFRRRVRCHIRTLILADAGSRSRRRFLNMHAARPKTCLTQ
jgi:hypothetical protein